MIRGGLFYLPSNRHADCDELEAGSGLPGLEMLITAPTFSDNASVLNAALRDHFRKKREKKKSIRKQFVPIFSTITVHFFLRQAHSTFDSAPLWDSSCFGKLASSGSEFLGGILFLSLSAAVAARRLGSSGCPGL